jgi:hypothetical protein
MKSIKSNLFISPIGIASIPRDFCGSSATRFSDGNTLAVDLRTQNLRSFKVDNGLPHESGKKVYSNLGTHNVGNSAIHTVKYEEFGVQDEIRLKQMKTRRPRTCNSMQDPAEG